MLYRPAAITSLVFGALPRFIAAAAFLGLGSMQAHTIDVADSVEVVWKSQQLKFEYRGYNTMYTCGGLRHGCTNAAEDRDVPSRLLP